MAPIDAVFKILDGDRPIPACFVLFAQLPVSVLLVLGLSRPQLIVAALIPRNAQNDARYTRRPARSQQTTALPRALAVLALVVRTDYFRLLQTPCFLPSPVFGSMALSTDGDIEKGQRAFAPFHA